MTPCSARNIPTLIVVQFLSFPIITTKKCFGGIFIDFSGPEYYRIMQSWKSSPVHSILHPKHTHIIQDIVFIVSNQYYLKML